MDHGEEEPVETVALAPIAKLHRPVECACASSQVTDAIIGDSEGIPDRPSLGQSSTARWAYFTASFGLRNVNSGHVASSHAQLLRAWAAL